MTKKQLDQRIREWESAIKVWKKNPYAGGVDVRTVELIALLKRLKKAEQRKDERE